MYHGLGEAFETLYFLVKWLLIIAVPLALWKLVDILVWLYNHVDINWV